MSDTGASSDVFKSPSQSSDGGSRDSSSERRRKKAMLTHPFQALPSWVTHWRMKHASLLNIKYDSDFLSSPLSVLEKVGNLAALTPLQERYLKILKFYLQSDEFDFKIDNLVGCRYKDRFEPVLDAILKKLESENKKPLFSLLYDTTSDVTTDLQKEDMKIECWVNLKIRNFIFVLKRLLGTIEKKKESGVIHVVPEISFCELPRQFADLCQIKSWNGKGDPSTLQDILGVKRVTSEPDLRMYKTGMSILNPEFPETVVSVIEIKRDSGQKLKESTEVPAKRRRSSSETSNTCAELPAILNKLSSDVLGQHAGELFLDYLRFALGPRTDEDMVYTMPGMIIDGTKIFFTLLEMTAAHHQKLLQCSGKTDLKKQLDLEKDKATIYYSEPLDMLVKNDREVLLDNFMRLNNL